MRLLEYWTTEDKRNELKDVLMKGYRLKYKLKSFYRNVNSCQRYKHTLTRIPKMKFYVNLKMLIDNQL